MFGMRKAAKPSPERAMPRIYIRELRKGRGWKQTDVLDRLEGHGVSITAASLSRYENSLQSPDTLMLDAFAQIFDVDIPDLFHEPPPKSAPTDLWEWRIARMSSQLTRLMASKPKK